MNLSQLEQNQRSNILPVITAIETLLAPYKLLSITPQLWESLLVLMWAVVEPAAIRAANFARLFYDAERARQGLSRHDIPLRVLNFDQFRADMAPVYIHLRGEESSDGDIHRAALRVARSIENSGRWTVIKAVEEPDPEVDELIEAQEEDDDPGDRVEEPKPMPKKKKSKSAPRIIKGWARVATGRETCGWCLMLVSRGPVYSSAKSAGAGVGDRDAVQLSGAGEFSSQDHMKAWHAGCDCKVVPVFRLDDWSGRDSYKAAERLWQESTKGYSGKDAVNAFRRAVEAGGFQEYLADERAA